ncbi:uncharacterized protein K02A2.6-like [Liolophura sinensis]|uniref:uncharacterized protein K02A2.6-like n=1 Tax=Liolophura sinensis TaxID=3198878 RepID=UPI003158FBAD
MATEHGKMKTQSHTKNENGLKMQNFLPPPNKGGAAGHANFVQSQVNASFWSDDEYVFILHSNNSNGQIKVNIANINVPMLIDSGASVNIVDMSAWEQIKKTGVTLEQCSKNVFPYGSTTPLELLGKCSAIVRFGDRTAKTELLIASTGTRSLLGKETAMQLGILKIGPKVNALSDKTSQSVKPVAQPIRRLPYVVRGKVEEKLKRVQVLDIIEPVSVSEWVSPLVVVPKPNGEDRICVDVCMANEAVVRQRHLIPTVDDILHEMNGAKVVSKIDLKWGYHQIELDEESRNITTFVTHKGLFRYKRLMFGISAAPEMYQNVISQVFEGCEGVRNLYDDIIVCGKDDSEHDQRLEEVFRASRTEISL